MTHVTIGSFIAGLGCLAVFGAYRAVGGAGIDASTFIGAVVAVVTTASLALVARG